MYVGVTCMGLDTANACSGVLIRIEPNEGYGQWSVTPCMWYDDEKAIIEERNKLEARQIVINMVNFILEPYGIAQRRERLLDYIDSLADEHKKVMDDEIKERYKGRGRIPGCDIYDLAYQAVRMGQEYPDEIDRYCFSNTR